MSDVAEAVKPEVIPEVDYKEKLENYNFEGHTYDPNFYSRRQRTGSQQLVSHRLCTYSEMTGLFLEATYRMRAGARSMDRMDPYGGLIKGIPTTVEQLMCADMDALMSTLNVGKLGKPTYVILYTNDREDKRWIDLLKRCPYAFPTMECDSKMGPYKVTQWVICKKDPRPTK